MFNIKQGAEAYDPNTGTTKWGTVPEDLRKNVTLGIVFNDKTRITSPLWWKNGKQFSVKTVDIEKVDPPDTGTPPPAGEQVTYEVGQLELKLPTGEVYKNTNAVVFTKVQG